MVDENGEPLVVYRGFNKKNDKGFIFKYGVNRFSNRLANRFAHYFTRSKNVALEYAEQGQKQDEKDIIVKSYFLNSRELLDITIKNPKYPKFEEWVKTRESIFSYSPYAIIEKLKKREIPTHSYLFQSVLSKAVNEDDLDELSLLKIKELELKIKKDEKEQKNIYKSSQTITLIQLLSLITNKTLNEIIQRDFNENDAEARRYVYEWFINHKSDRKLVTDDLDVVLKNLIIDEGFDGGKFMEHQFGVKNEKDFEVYFVFDSEQIKLADGTNTTFDANNPDIRYEEGGEIQSMINEGIVEIEFYDTTIAHAKEYGIESKKPLYLKRIFVSENNRNKGIGKKFLKYLYHYAVENGNDVIFGHIATKSSYIGILKNLLLENGYIINDKNNDFYIMITKENKYEQGGLLAPNGKKSNLTAEQWKLVRTTAFKKFFGDWENDPENASKVVDENGEPLVVYRGFPKKRKLGNVFRYKANMFGTKGVGGRQTNNFAFYFADRKEIAEEYGKNLSDSDSEYIVKEYFLNVRNIFKAYEYKNQTKITFCNLFDLSNPTEEEKEKIFNAAYHFSNLYYKCKKNKEFYDKHFQNDTFTYFVDWNKEHNNQWFWGYYLQIIKKFDGLVFYEDTHDDYYDSINKIVKLKYDEISKTYGVFEPNNIKLADGTNTTFDANNPDIRYEEGGDLKKSSIISLPDTYSSYDSLKPILENQGYELIKKNNLEMSTEKLEIEDNRSVSELDMKYPELPHSFINKQLMSGIEHEMEHTEDPRVSKKIAIDHLLENIHYYEYLAEMEQKMQGKNIDEHYESITKMYEEGGKVETFEFSTPTGKTSKLNYLQQVLVRTKAFKNFFGDWELAARNYQNGKLEFNEAYKNVSKCIDDSTLEPRVVYHGTQADKEFFTFDVTQEKKIGRPYAYFAYNREYSLNFSGGTNKGYMYAVFLNIRNPFNASGETFLKNRDSSYWLTSIKGQISLDKYGDVTKRKELSDTVDSQIKSYIEEVYTNQPYYFWLLMARDVNKEFKYFLMSHGYDGIFASENFTNTFDTENPSEFTYTYIAFDANQIKLADGRNIDFDPMNADIRYEEGGKTVEKVEVVVEQQEPTQNVSQIDYLRNNLRKFSQKDAEINKTIFKSGGHVQKDSGSPDDAKDGGLFVGRSHATGGIKAINLSTNQPIEVEGGEVIITKPAVEDQTKREFEGKMMTNKEILSHINQSGGGVSFEKGGEMGNSCGCSGKMYKFGGETISDYMVLRKISTIYDESIKNVKNYVDNLSEQFK